MTQPSLQCRYCIVCDDVRHETSGKDSLIGVYVAGVLVPSMPKQIHLTFWVPVIWTGDGELGVQLQVVNPQNQPCGQSWGRFNAILPGLESSLTFPGVALTIQSEGIHDVQVATDTSSWVTLRRLAMVLQRPSANASLPPS